jgi:hypothetical protein
MELIKQIFAGKVKTGIGDRCIQHSNQLIESFFPGRLHASLTLRLTDIRT